MLVPCIFLRGNTGVKCLFQTGFNAGRFFPYILLSLCLQITPLPNWRVERSFDSSVSRPPHLLSSGFWVPLSSHHVIQGTKSPGKRSKVFMKKEVKRGQQYLMHGPPLSHLKGLGVVGLDVSFQFQMGVTWEFWKIIVVLKIAPKIVYFFRCGVWIFIIIIIITILFLISWV